jgi:hypothetical protein
VSPESFSLMESVMIVAMVVLGGIGHLPGRDSGCGAAVGLPEVLRYVAGPLQAMTGWPPGLGLHPAPVADRSGHDHHHADAPARPVAVAGAWQVAANQHERRAT